MNPDLMPDRTDPIQLMHAFPQIIESFQGHLSIDEIAKINHCPPEAVEAAIRAYIILLRKRLC